MKSLKERKVQIVTGTREGIHEIKIGSYEIRPISHHRQYNPKCQNKSGSLKSRVDRHGEQHGKLEDQAQKFS